MILDLLLALLLSALASASTALYHHQNHGTHNYYVLHHDPAYASLADVAEHLGGLQIVEPVGELKDIWLARIPRNILDSRKQHGEVEVDDPVVETYRRMRRQTSLLRRGEDMSLSLRHLSRLTTGSQRRVALSPFPNETTASSPTKRAPVDIKDPLFKDQWSLPLLNAPAAWENGYTGKGVVVAIMDHGVRPDHKDLNYAAEHSYDFVANSKTQPTDSQTLSHGTASAGIVAASRNNLCGVGIAYDSKVSSLRILEMNYDSNASPQEYSTREAAAFNYHYDAISIYSGGFGTEDDGASASRLTYVGLQALLNGANKGRDGKGSIFVFGAGNGGASDIGDHCTHNGYVNSIYTIAIGAVEKSGLPAEYSEPCAAIMATVYSSAFDKSSTITSLGSSSDVACEKDYGGTSAAAPAAAAIFALALQVRPDLTWRDMQHLCVETAQFPKGQVSADKLVKGRKYNIKVGFGVLDASIFVEKAKTWSLVKPQVWIEPQYVQVGRGTVNGKMNGGLPLTPKGVSRSVKITKEMAEDSDFGEIEHIQVRVWMEHERRGDIQVTIFSPQNVVCALGLRRQHDKSALGLMGWTFMTVKHWGEDPVGEWKVVITDRHVGDPTDGTRKSDLIKIDASDDGHPWTPERIRGRLFGFSMTFWGSAKNGDNAKPYEMPPDDHDIFPPPNARYVMST